MRFETFQETDPNGACMQNLGTACVGAFSDSKTLGPKFKQLLAAEPRTFPLGTQNFQYGGAGVYTSYTPATMTTPACGVFYPVPIYAQASMAQKIEQANLGFAYELRPGYVLETNYVGTFGRKLVGLRDANNYDGRLACTTLTAACAAAGYTAPFSGARPNLTFTATTSGRMASVLTTTVCRSVFAKGTRMG